MYDETIPVITIDGPSGTGKGTLCHLLAQHLAWNLLDSGAIYRVMAFAAQKARLSANDIDALVQLALTLALRFESKAGQAVKVLLDNEDVTEQIRSERCGQEASQLAAIPELRQALLERQRLFAKPPGLVTDGRDMGTVVFPKAILKIFLSATAKERANRRYFQLKEKGIRVSLADVVEELTQRDARDTARRHAPLKPADDSVKIDTTGLNIEQVFQVVLKLVEKVFGGE